MVRHVPGAFTAAAGLAWICGLAGIVSVAGPLARADDGPIRVAGSSWVVDAPTKVADALRLFPRADGQPEIRVDAYDSGRGALQSLLSGTAEFALAASTPVARALLDAHAGRGPPLAVLAATSISNQTHALVANPASGIDAPGDLSGRRVGMLFGTSGHFGWYQFAHHHGLPVDAVSLVDLPIVDQHGALRDGRVDAVFNWEPWTTRARESLGAGARVFTTRQLYTVSWLLVTRRDVVERYPGAAERVLAGYAAAMLAIEADLSGALAHHARAIGADPDSLAGQADDVIWGLRLDWPIVADLEAQFSWISDHQEVAADGVPSPADYLYGQPLAAVYPRAITLPAYFFADSDGQNMP